VKRNLLLGLAILVLALVATTVLYYRGLYRPAISQPLAFEEIVSPSLAPIEFTDTSKKTEGRIIFDLGHENNFILPEVDLLSLRLASRGLSIDYFEESELDEDGEEVSLKEKLFGKDKREEDNEEDNLNNESNDSDTLDIKALVIIAPQNAYTTEDLDAVKDFVEEGGRLLLLGDPTRPSQINRIAVLYGLIFESDYLYNLKENAGNYRSVYFSEFRENKITRGVQKVVLFTAGSISSDDQGIAFGDGNTQSTLIQSAERLSPLAIAEGAKVLAVHDLTFMTKPYSDLLDNNRLIANTANWLADLPTELPEEKTEKPPTTEPE
jgi:hypothetical protein